MSKRAVQKAIIKIAVPMIHNGKALESGTLGADVSYIAKLAGITNQRAAIISRELAVENRGWYYSGAAYTKSKGGGALQGGEPARSRLASLSWTKEDVQRWTKAAIKISKEKNK